MAAVVQLARTGDKDQADRILDALEAETGLAGERNSSGRRYAFAGSETVSEGADRLAAALGRVSTNWQQHLVFEL